MKILVTGNLGYVGTVMTPMLAQEGHEVTGLDTAYFEDCVVGQLPAAGVVRQVVKDVRELEREDVRGFDAIIHLAALSNDPMGDLDPQLTEAVNLRASQRLAEMSKEVGVPRFLFASSCSVYGHGGGAPVTEAAPLRPLTAYARSKVEFEKTLNELADERFSPLSFRNATAYGFSPRLRVDLVVNNLLGSALASGQVKLLSDGTAWRPLVHVEDMSRAFVTALSVPRERWRNLALNVGAEVDNFQIRSLASLVAELVPNCTVTIATGASTDNRNYNVSFERIRTVLPEWRPAHTVESGTRHLYAALQRAQFGRSDFEGHRYVRLAHLLDHKAQGRLTTDLRWNGSHGL